MLFITALFWNIVSVPSSSFNEITKEFTISKCPEGEYPCNISYAYLETAGPSKTCTKITIEKGIHVIQANAIYNILTLSEISISSSVYLIELPFCRWCKNLKSISVSEDNNFFQGLNGCIYEYGFQKLVRAPPLLDTVLLSGKLQCIMSQSFGVAGYRTLTIPRSVFEIQAGSFYDSYILEIIFEDNSSMVTLSANALAIIGGLQKVKLPISLKILGSGAIKQCGKLSLVDFGENSSIETISDSAFYEDKSLSEIILPPRLKTIGDSAFGLCTSLKALNFPSSVESIHLNAFSGCSGIESISVDPTNTHYEEDSGILFNKDKSIVLILPINIKKFPIADTLTSISVTSIQLCPDLVYLNISDTHPKYENNHLLLIDKNTKQLVGIAGGVTELEIPSHVTSLGDYCATQLTKIKHVTIPSNIQSIGTASFMKSSVTSVAIIGGISVTLGGSAFEGCTSLESVTFPSLGSIVLGYKVFSGTSNLGDVVFDCQVSNMYGHAFSYSGVKSVRFNNGNFIAVNEYTFCTTLSLKSVQLPSTVKSIVTTAFQSSRLNQLTFLGGNNVETIGSDSFYDCSKLVSIDKFTKIKSIGTRGFEGCYSLESIDFDDECPITQLLSANMFSNCQKLKNINLPRYITEVEPSIFNGCILLTEINASPNSENLITKEGILFNKDGALIVCPPGKIDADVSKGVSKLSVRCFYGCSKLINLIFPDISTFSEIGDQTFAGCSSLLHLRIPNSVSTVSGKALIGCEKLNKIEFGSESKLSNLGSSAFSECPCLVDINIVVCKYLKTIPESCFESCSSIWEIELNPIVETINSSAFKDCTNLSTVSFGDKSQLLRVSDNAFYNCAKLISIAIPQSVEEIGQTAFANCAIDDTLIVPSSLSSIGLDAFAGPQMTIKHVIYCGSYALSVRTFGDRKPEVHVPLGFGHATTFKLSVNRDLDRACTITTQRYVHPGFATESLLFSQLLISEESD